MLFVNPTTPELRIYNPETGGWARFTGGKLDIDESDPDFKYVMAEAQRNPAISIHAKGVNCPECGELFTGKTARMDLGKHRKGIHFDKWLADQDALAAAERDVQVKSRAGYVCDICQPVQEFGTADDLAGHVSLLHAAPPELTETGETIGGDDGGSGGGQPIDTSVPAAAPAGGDA